MPLPRIMLTVIETCRQQERNTFAFVADAVLYRHFHLIHNFSVGQPVLAAVAATSIDSVPPSTTPSLIWS